MKFEFTEEWLMSFDHSDVSDEPRGFMTAHDRDILNQRRADRKRTQAAVEGGINGGIMTAIPFDHYIFERLQDPEFAALYLHYALEDGGVEEFLMASKQYAQAHRLASSELVLPETVTESLKAALAVSFEAYVIALGEVVASPDHQKRPI